MARVARAASAALFLSACIDAGARFDDFHERSVRAHELDASAADAGSAPLDDASVSCQAPTAAQLEGRFYVAVITAAAPDKPILSQMDVSAKDVEGGVDVTMAVRLVSAKDRRTPVGDVTEAKGTLRGTQFEMPTVTFFIPGEANPLMEGIEGRVDVSFRGDVCVADDEPVATMCGVADAVITDPLHFVLEDSSYGAVRVPAGDAAEWPMWRGGCEGAKR